MRLRIFYFLFLLLFSVNMYAYTEYPLSAGGGFSFSFLNFSEIDSSSSYSRVLESGLSLDSFFDAKYAIFSLEYSSYFSKLLNSSYFSLGLDFTYPFYFSDKSVKLLFPLIGFKYAFSLKNTQKNLFFVSLGLAGDIFLPQVNNLFLRPFVNLSFAPFAFKKSLNSLATQISIGLNLGYQFRK